MSRTSRNERARLSVGKLDRITLAIHGTLYLGGTREQCQAAWEVVRDELIEEALGHQPLILPEAWWRFEGPEELRPLEFANGRTAIVGDTWNRRNAWLLEHAAELGLAAEPAP